MVSVPWCEIPEGSREMLCFSLSPFRITGISGSQPGIILPLCSLQGHLAVSGDIFDCDDWGLLLTPSD